MNANPTECNRKKLVWASVGIVLGALVSTNPFYAPPVTLGVGIAAWCVALGLVLVL